MKLLDRYILRQFLINFIILLVVLTSLFVVVDLLVELDEFLQAGRLFAEQYGGVLPATLVTIGDFYGPVLVLIYVFCAAVPVLGAMGFTLAGLARSREATAIVSSGVSMYRIAAPILIAGVVLCAASLPLQELVIPHLSEKLSRTKSDVDNLEQGVDSLRFMPDESGNLLSAGTFHPAQEKLTDVTIHERDAEGLATRRITAAEAWWVAGDDETGSKTGDVAGQRPGWRLMNGWADHVGGLEQALRRPISQRREEVEFFETGLSPKVLIIARQSGLYPWFLSMQQLQRMQQNPAVSPAQRANITRILWSRFSMLTVSTLVLVMGLSFFMHVGQPNLLLQGLKAAGVCLPMWGLGLAVIFTGLGPLNPIATAWLPVVLYLPLSAILLQFVKT